MWLVIVFVAGIFVVPAVNLLLGSSQGMRVVAVLGLIAWPFRSFYVWLTKGGKEQRKALGYLSAFQSLKNIMYQLRTNLPWYTNCSSEE
jgi:hypothetical protein